MSPSPIKVISLTRTPERRTEFARRNPHLDYVFFDAVDGQTLTRDAVAATGLFPPGLPYTRGAYGAALSHLALWEETIARNETMTIAEDDVVFRPDFRDLHTQLLSELPPTWDIVLWGTNFGSTVSFWLPFGIRTAMCFDVTHVLTAMERLKLDTTRPHLHRLEFTFGLPAYTITPAGARRFKRACFPMREFTRSYNMIPQPLPNFGIDSAMNQVYMLAGAYFSFPPLVVTPNDGATSTIEHSGPLEN